MLCIVICISVCDTFNNKLFYYSYYNPKDLSQALHQSAVAYRKEYAVDERLKINCEEAGLQLLGVTPGNGNCFFEAVGSQLERLSLQRVSLCLNIYIHVNN
jgi:hypothetical protein